jgi:hypothetical protein
MRARASRYPLLLAWLPPPLAVGIALWATRQAPPQGAPLPSNTSRFVGTALLVGGILCLLGAILGLRRSSVGAREPKWPYVIAVPVALMMIAIWKMFFGLP